MEESRIRVRLCLAVEYALRDYDQLQNSIRADSVL